MSDQKNKVDASSDEKELHELLDSALADFTSHKPDKKAEVASKDVKETVEATGSSEEVDPLAGDALWSDEFLKHAAAQFETHMAGILGGSGVDAITPDQLGSSFQRMAEAAALALQPENMANMPPVDPDFASTIAQTLQGISSGADNLQTPFSSDELSSMFGNLDMLEGNQNSFLPFMQGMMQSLLSAEVLLPSLKDLLIKYPEWIEKHKDEVTPEDLERYQKQQNLMREVCTELEKEQEEDTPEVKKQRFDKVLELMQKMQDLGQPPKELVGDLGVPLQLDDQVPSNIDPSQCSIM